MAEFWEDMDRSRWRMKRNRWNAACRSEYLQSGQRGVQLRIITTKIEDEQEEQKTGYTLFENTRVLGPLLWGQRPQAGATSQCAPSSQ